MGIKIIVDTPNLLFRVGAQHAKKSNSTDPEESAGLALHMAFQSVFKYYKKFKPELMAFVFEGEANWRKTYTRSDVCVSKRVYKANRVKDPSMQAYFEMLASFKEVIEKHSSLMVIQHPELEGDDCVAAFVQKYANGIDEVIIISGDRDYIQLLEHPNVRLINPDTGKDRNTPDEKEYWESIDYFKFFKCVRGDMGDYVFSAFPKVRETKIIKAFEDEQYRVSFMEEIWESPDLKDQDGNPLKMKVGELFEENKKLMILDSQPDYIKELMTRTVDEAYDNINKYSQFHFLKFLGKHQLMNIVNQIDQFTDMLSVNTRYKLKLSDPTYVENVEQTSTKPKGRMVF